MESRQKRTDKEVASKGHRRDKIEKHKQKHTVDSRMYERMSWNPILLKIIKLERGDVRYILFTTV